MGFEALGWICLGPGPPNQDADFAGAGMDMRSQAFKCSCWRSFEAWGGCLGPWPPNQDADMAILHFPGGWQWLGNFFRESLKSKDM